MTPVASRWLVAVVLIGLAAARGEASAQPGGGRVEAGGGTSLGGGVSFGQARANLDRPSGDTLALFRTESGQSREMGLVAHLSTTLTGPVAVEASGTWSHARLRTRVTGDLEGASDTTLEQSFSRFTVEVAAVWSRQATSQVIWYLRGGGGWLRDVTGDGVAVDGGIARVGAGVKYWWVRRGGGLRYGVRVEGGLAARRRGLTLADERVHVAPALVAGLIIGS